MNARFRCSDPLAGDFEFADVEDVLDALEAALVSPDTPMLDAVRQSWQPVAAHPEVRAAWIERSRFRPPTGTGLALPELPALAAVAAASDDDEGARRREAYARVRGRPVREEIPAEEVPQSGRPRLATLVIVGTAVLLGLIGWGIVSLAIRLAAIAAQAAGVER
ncbi:MAG: hypothetical protein H0T68_10900 [Gemmatimonadales bacterium]|nr:hypothetical protein [Gemmatimonadales bacterium]